MASTRISSAAKLSQAAIPKINFGNIFVTLPVEQPAAQPSQTKLDELLEEYRRVSAKKEKSFSLHIGANLRIPSKDALAKPEFVHQTREQLAQIDPFEGLPFRAFAERVGDHILPVIKAAKEDQRRAVLEGKHMAESAQPVQVPVPHFLPFTRWAANNERIKATFVADDPKSRKKARLSWYHPEDTMVPRGWFTQGLLADIKYYMPFGLGASSDEAVVQPAAQ